MVGGVNLVSLDAKGRLAIPAKHRESIVTTLGSSLVVTLESSEYLILYPEFNWQPVQARLLALPTGNPILKSYQRLLLGHAETLEMDGAGRILLPARLRELTGLKKEVALVGMGNRFELWNAQNWEAQTHVALGMSQADLAMQLGDFSL